MAVLVRADSLDEAKKKLWKSFQLHMDFASFLGYIGDRVDIYLGDITRADLGLDLKSKEIIYEEVDSIIHCAAVLNRKSFKACYNVNLKGTLEVITMANTIHKRHPIRRFSFVSTVTIAGVRKNEIVREEEALDWGRSDYDTYSRTKKFCEHMVKKLLFDIPVTIFRPSAIIGDSRFPKTTQFDLVKALVICSKFPILPLSSKWKVDIVPADYVGKAIVTIHQKASPKYDIYHLSAGKDSLTYREIFSSLKKNGRSINVIFFPFLEKVNYRSGAGGIEPRRPDRNPELNHRNPAYLLFCF